MTAKACAALLLSLAAGAPDGGPPLPSAEIWRLCPVANTCAQASLLSQCIERDRPIEALRAILDAMVGCLGFGAPREEVQSALAAVAIQSKPLIAAAVREALVASGAFSPAAAQLIPSDADRKRIVRKLFAGRTDRYRRFAQDADACRLVTGESSHGEVTLRCQNYDGCLGACDDRVLVATVRLSSRGASIASLTQESADTGACGCCEMVR